MRWFRKLGTKTILIIIVTILVVLIGAGLKLFNQNNTPVVILPKTKIVIANVGEYSIFNLIAKEKGFFEQNSLDAEVIEYPSGPPGVAAMLAGSADFSVAADFVGVSNIFAKKDIRILAQATEQDVFSVIGRKDKGVYSPKDIKGKRVGVTRKGAGEFFLGRFLTFNDLALSDIKIVDLQPPELVKQLESGQLDAIVIFEPHTYNLKKSLGDQLSIFSAQGQEKTRAIVYTTTATTQSRPEVVKQYIQSLVQAESYLKANPNGAKAILAKKMGYQQDQVDYLWTKIDFSLSLPQELLLTLENEARYSISSKLTNETEVPNYLNYIYFDALNSVKPDGVTIVR